VPRRGAANASPAPPIAAPSILSADFSDLAGALAIVDPRRDWVHCDVMDSHFVPNLTFGPLIVRAARRLSEAFLDVHLMIERPLRLVSEFRGAGADQITVHLEAAHDGGVGAALARIRASGARAGLALRPGTRLAEAEPHLDAIDVLLLMTVEPGFGGQAFMADQLAKIAAAAASRGKRGARWPIEVDGGIDPENGRRCRDAGADVFVAGSAIYHARSPRRSLAALRRAIGGVR
jgi:ribulose-phosphate 3-epimerase